MMIATCFRAPTSVLRALIFILLPLCCLLLLAALLLCIHINSPQHLTIDSGPVKADVMVVLGFNVLVELHDGKNPGVSERIRGRFKDSHQIETIWRQPRSAADFPFVNTYTRKLSPEHLASEVDEGRPVRDGVEPMSWFWMAPKLR